ncbi:MAG: hypothetical protein HY897_09045 [Deltaproteobacteria bacterium]|nr:hypothetical protein [Deltaproteobacteria bacterium]
MPRNEAFINPYRLLRQPRQPKREYRTDLSRLSGYVGELKCLLEVHTPLEVNFAKDKQFNTNPRIPGASLKGLIRNTAEFVGGGCMSVSAQGRNDGPWSLCAEEKCCVTCDMFGRIAGRLHNRGKVNIGEAIPIEYRQHAVVKILQGSPKETHAPFYPRSTGTECYRKFYHHQPSAQKEIPNDQPIGKFQPNLVYPVEPGSVFGFQVAFEGLDKEQLALLTYSLELEPGLLHKFGRGKGKGMGSVKIKIAGAAVNTPADRYQGIAPAGGWPEDVRKTLRALREDKVLDGFRRMTSWAAAPEHLGKVRYPTYHWFKDVETGGSELRPVEEVIRSLPATMADPELPVLGPGGVGAATTAPSAPAASRPADLDDASWNKLDNRMRGIVARAARLTNYKKDSEPFVNEFKSADEEGKRAIVAALVIAGPGPSDKEWRAWAKEKFGTYAPAAAQANAPADARANLLDEARRVLLDITDPKKIGKKLFAKGKLWDKLDEAEKRALALDIARRCEELGQPEQVKKLDIDKYLVK